ncbi:tetratricopeptide repeat protein [Azospirillum sp. B510]|uniref:tetratricopeptide repeat protein n=1 Tax=Azospirillum sp. (strain B510) TaxID=137722 RepID=UPI0005A7C000|nr:glycosyltransferase family 41 protein [Azospirillum sp. B510]
MQPDIDGIRQTLLELLARLECHHASAEGKIWRNPPEHGVSLPEETLTVFEATLRSRLQQRPADRKELYFLLGACRLLKADLGFAIQAFHLCVAEDEEWAPGHVWLGHLHFGMGALVLAWACYRRALVLQPDDARLYRHLSCSVYAKDTAMASSLLERAIRLNCTYVEGRRNLARCRLARNASESSIGNYQRVLALEPDHAEAWRNLGNVMYVLRRLDDAGFYFRRALILDPASVAIRTSLSDVHLISNRPDEAAALQRTVIADRGRVASVQTLPETLAELPESLFAPETGDIARLLAGVLPSAHAWRDGPAWAIVAYSRGLEGDAHGCLEALDRAVMAAPRHVLFQLDRELARLMMSDDADAATELGRLFATGDAVCNNWLESVVLHEAFNGMDLLGSWWRKTLTQTPSVWRRLQSVLPLVLDGPETADDGRYRLVLSALTCEPDGSGPWPDHLRRWAELHRGADRSACQTALYQAWRLIQFWEDRDMPMCRAVADVLFEQDDLLLSAWLEAFGISNARAGCADPWMEAMFAGTARMLEFTRNRPDLDDLLPHILLAACFLARSDAVYALVTRFWIERLRGWEHWHRFAGEIPARIPASAADRKMRVGYVVHDFRYQDFCPEHNVVRLHDTERFDVSVFFATPQHSPTARRLEGLPPLLRDFPGRVHNINGLAPEDSAALINAEGVGVLFDTFGWWAGEIPRIFAQRPAPVQATWCGLSRPGKEDIMDYIVGNDDLFRPGEEDGLPEGVVRLDGAYIPVKPRTHVPQPLSRSALGIPEDCFVFLGYHQVMKINKKTLDLWMEVLRNCPNSILILNWTNPWIIRNLARSHGIDASRIMFFRFVRTEVEHLMRLGVADLFLDTNPFTSAALTGADALYMKVPRITLVEANLYSRFGQIMMNGIGLNDWVCHDRKEFIERAVALYRTPEDVQAIRQRIGSQVIHSESLDPAKILRKLEKAIEVMWDRHCTGLPPTSFRV